MKTCVQVMASNSDEALAKATTLVGENTPHRQTDQVSIIAIFKTSVTPVLLPVTNMDDFGLRGWPIR